MEGVYILVLFLMLIAAVLFVLMAPIMGTIWGMISSLLEAWRERGTQNEIPDAPLADPVLHVDLPQNNEVFRHTFSGYSTKPGMITAVVSARSDQQQAAGPFHLVVPPQYPCPSLKAEVCRASGQTLCLPCSTETGQQCTNC